MKSILLLLPLLPLINAFAPPRGIHICNAVRGYRHRQTAASPSRRSTHIGMIDKKRRDQLGIADDEDEYDLYKALDTNTDSGITKIIAGSFILVMIALLVVGLVIPSITDYGDGLCSPIQNGGRC